MQDWESELQARAEAHLDACIAAEDEWAFHDQSDDDDVEWPHSPAVAPFCGCTTCVVREVLHAAWPLMIEHAMQEAASPATDVPDAASLDES